MKKGLLGLGLGAMVALSLVACGNNSQPTPTSGTQVVEDKKAPEITGNKDLTSTVGEAVNLLANIKALDDTDGDISSKVTVTTLPELTVTNGSVTPTQTGEYEVQYKVTDKAGNVGEAFATLTVNPKLAEKEVYVEYSFDTTGELPFTVWGEHEEVKPKAEIAKGNLVVTGKTDNEAWHSKFGDEIKVKAAAEYEVIYEVTSSVAGNVTFEAYDAKADKTVALVQGFNKLSFKFTAPAAKDDQGFCLQLGALPTDYELGFSHIEIIESVGQDVWKNQLNNFAFDAQGVTTSVFDNNSTGTVTTTETSATMNITRGSDENGVWQTKLFVKAGMDLAKDTKYRITVDVEAEKAINQFEICYNNGDNEKGIGALYDQKVEAGVKKTIEFVVTPDAAKDNLTLQFQFGKQNTPQDSNVITVSNFKVEKAIIEDEDLVKDYSFESAGILSHYWGGSEGTFTAAEDGSKAVLSVAKGANEPNPWEIRTFLGFGEGLEKGRTYKATVDLKSSVAVTNFEVAYGKFEDTDPTNTALKGQELAANETKTIVLEGVVSEDIANAGLTFSLGSIQTAATVEFSNLEVIALGGAKEVSTLDSYVFTPDGFGTYNEASSGAEGYLYVEDGKLVYEMASIALVDWHNKMYISKVNLEADKIYTIEIKAKADKNISCAFFVNPCGKWDPRVSEEMAFTTEEKTFEFVTPKFAADMDFEVLFQFGSDVNHALGSAKIEISSIIIYSQDVE